MNYTAADKGLLKKHQKALQADETELYQLVHDPDRDFLALLLSNPRIHEEHLLALLKRRDLSIDLVERIHRIYQQTLSHRLLLAMVRNPAISGSLARNLLPRLRIFELLDICLLPGLVPEQKLAAERLLLTRLPELPLGQKITLARRGTSEIVGELLKEGQPQVIEACLSNPHLKEMAVHRFLRLNRAGAEAISLIAQHSRWKERPELKLAILKHPRTPDVLLTHWLPRLSRPVLKQLLTALRSQPHKARMINQELQRRNA